MENVEINKLKEKLEKIDPQVWEVPVIQGYINGTSDMLKSFLCFYISINHNENLFLKFSVVFRDDQVNKIRLKLIPSDCAISIKNIEKSSINELVYFIVDKKSDFILRCIFGNFNSINLEGS